MPVGAGKGSVVEWAGWGGSILAFQFPFTLSLRQYKVCCVRETAGRVACSGWCDTGWKMTSRSMRK